MIFLVFFFCLFASNAYLDVLTDVHSFFFFKTMVNVTDSIAAYYPLVLVIIGTLLNTLTLIILCRTSFRNAQVRPTIFYMRTIAIFDILMLYGWNFDHYLFLVYGFYLQRLNIGLCRFLSFFNYFTSQTSAWLRIFVCLDRYLSVSRIHSTWFGQWRHVLMIIGGILIFFLLLNFHFFLFACSYRSNGTISVQSSLYSIYPQWDYLNLVIYNCIPFLMMIILNGGVSYHLFHIKHDNQNAYFRYQQRAITITLAIMTFLFFIMTVPATVAFAFFFNSCKVLLTILDGCLYSYHALTFLVYFVTFGEFRRGCWLLFRFNRRRSRRTAAIPLRQFALN